MEDELTAERIAQRDIAFSREMKKVHSSGSSYPGTSVLLNNNVDINTHFSQEFLDLCLVGVAQSEDRARFLHLISQGANPNTALRDVIAQEASNIKSFVEQCDVFHPMDRLEIHPYPGTQFLLNNNADINHVFPDGRTLLDEYIDKSDESVARVLIRHKADLNNSLTKRLANAEKGVEVSNLDILEKLVNFITPKTQQSEVPITTQFAGDNIQIIKTLMEQMQKYNNTPLKPISDNNTPLNLVSNSYGTIESSEELHDASLLGDS
jgi:hypothetical protein